MQLFYQPYIDPSAALITFDKTESRHIIKVLRKSVRDQIWIFDGKGSLYESVIVEANEKKCVVRIVNSTQHNTGRDYRLHIAIAPTKLNDRFEWFLEKATEIGIDEITPIFCQRSERKVVKIDRMRKILIAAAKQSLHFHMPVINPPLSFSDFIVKPVWGKKCIAHCNDTQRKPFKQVLTPNEDITMMIGPEGDFTTFEIEQSLVHKYIPVSLGTSRLRTETAGIAAAHSVAFINE